MWPEIGLGRICRTRNGHHRFGVLKFTNRAKTEVIQKCRFCTALWVGKNKAGRWTGKTLFEETISQRAGQVDDNEMFKTGTKNDHNADSELNGSNGL